MKNKDSDINEVSEAIKDLIAESIEFLFEDK